MNTLLRALLIAFLFDSIATASIPECKTIAKCDDSNKKRDICISYRQSNDNISYYNISSCNNNKTCPFNEVKGTSDVKCVERKDKARYLDGEECFGNSTCFSNHCSSENYCVGKANMTQCDSTEECAKGLFCFNSKCNALVPIGGICRSEYECVVQAGCSLVTNRCIPYFSLKSGEKTPKPDLCESGFADFFGRDMVCADKNLTLDDCDHSGQCTYEKTAKGYPTVVFQEECKCSLKSSDKKFCALGSTNPTYKEAIRYMNATYDVHTLKRLIPKSLYERRRVMEALSYPKFKDVDSCVIDLYLASSYIKVSLSALLLVLML